MTKSKLSQTEYDPTNNTHRNQLAKNLLTLCQNFARYDGSMSITQADGLYGEVIVTIDPDLQYKRGLVWVRVYTSISYYKGKPYMRRKDSDAVRIVFMWDGVEHERCLYKTKMYRKGTFESILKRFITKLEDGVGCIRKSLLCPDCGSPMFVAKSSGRHTCSDLCWKK
jgi:ribosomal protein S27AE